MRRTERRSRKKEEAEAEGWVDGHQKGRTKEIAHTSWS
jgi:hypothetical protein